jgi:hypothetical protein
MLIPVFSLPSNPAKKIQLREATVADALDFADTADGHNEEVTTLFLNRVQHKETFYDSKLWTAEDRNLGLYWYWMHTAKDPEIPLTYDCEFCGKSHTWLFDMRTLAETYQTIDGMAERDIEFGGHKITVHPLTGDDMESLENMAMGLDVIEEESGTKSREYRKALAELRLSRFEKMVKFKSGDADTIIKNMGTSDFTALVEAVSDALASMKHGLTDLRYTDEGDCYLLTSPHKCPNGEGETRLRVPFRGDDYIPRL